MTEFAVILPAAGSSSRFGNQRNKLIAPLRGEPVIVHSIRAFTRREDVSHAIIPTSTTFEIRDAIAATDSTVLADPRVGFCPGGGCRAESVLCGLHRLPNTVEWVAIHDAARPLVSQQLIDQTLAGAVEHGACVPALPMHLTVKQATGPLPARVQRTVPRAELWTMQTPQIMRRADLIEAFAKSAVPLEQITDDVQLLEMIGTEVWLIAGDERNLKITTPIDMQLAEAYLK